MKNIGFAVILPIYLARYLEDFGKIYVRIVGGEVCEIPHSKDSGPSEIGPRVGILETELRPSLILHPIACATDLFSHLCSHQSLCQLSEFLLSKETLRR